MQLRAPRKRAVLTAGRGLVGAQRDTTRKNGLTGGCDKPDKHVSRRPACPHLRHDRTFVQTDRVQFLTHMYGPAVRCKRFVDLVVSGLASMYPVSSWSCFAPDHH